MSVPTKTAVLSKNAIDFECRFYASLYLTILNRKKNTHKTKQKDTRLTSERYLCVFVCVWDVYWQNRCVFSNRNARSCQKKRISDFRTQNRWIFIRMKYTYHSLNFSFNLRIDSNSSGCISKQHLAFGILYWMDFDLNIYVCDDPKQRQNLFIAIEFVHPLGSILCYK